MKASAVRIDLRDPVQQDMVMREVARAEAVWVVLRHGLKPDLYPCPQAKAQCRFGLKRARVGFRTSLELIENVYRLPTSFKHSLPGCSSSVPPGERCV